MHPYRLVRCLMPGILVTILVITVSTLLRWGASTVIAGEEQRTAAPSKKELKTFFDKYNSLLWKFFKAVDEVKEGYYKSSFEWTADDHGNITSLTPDVDYNLSAGSQTFRRLGFEVGELEPFIVDEMTARLAKVLLVAVNEAKTGTNGIVKFYETEWRRKTEIQAGQATKRRHWNMVWEAMRSLWTNCKSNLLHLVDKLETPPTSYTYDPATKKFRKYEGLAYTVKNTLPPIIRAESTRPGTPVFGFWFKLGTKAITVSPPRGRFDQFPGLRYLSEGDVIEGVFMLIDDEEKLLKFDSIVGFSQKMNSWKELAGKTFHFSIRRRGRTLRIQAKSSPAEGGNLFRR